MSHALTLTPGGHLFVEADEQAQPKLSQTVADRLNQAFSASSARGLELLGGEFLDQPLPPTFVFWRGVAQRFFTAVCHNPIQESSAVLHIPPPSEAELGMLVENAPPMKGLEYLTVVVLGSAWESLGTHVRDAIGKTPGGAAAYLKNCNPVWNTVGRVTFHLAENKKNPAYPFAFLATYTHRISDQGKVQHLPLGRALEEYAGAKNRAGLATLLAPVQRAADQSKLARELLDSRAVFYPQVWRPEQAFAFLKNIPLLEQSGVAVRIPDWWKAGRPPRPQVSVRIGGERGGLLGADSLLDFKVQMSLEGEPLTEEELKSILESASGLVLLKGKWVEVDQERLKEVLDHWKKVQSAAGPGGVPLLEGLRLLSGFDASRNGEPEAEAARAQWSRILPGEALKKVLEDLHQPQASVESDPGGALRAQLRPYQRQGAHWLWFMNRLGLGACLADDMGLGKTIQVLSLLLVLKQRPSKSSPPEDVCGPSLLIVPASLIANWKSEIQRFAPSLCVAYAHPSELPAEQLAAVGKSPAQQLAANDLVITSYSMAIRLAWLKEVQWKMIVLDEAQAIKNPGARQSRAVKELRSHHRVALSGTPIENRLSDLWSLFDFLCPGLLGGAREFAAFLKSRSQSDQTQFAPLRRLVRPYILRRLKTDKRVIADLPDKTEMTAFCALTRRQAALYQQTVAELAERLESPEVEGIQRRGIILAFLTRFKQICNHPSQWLGDAAYTPAESGKFQRLTDLCEEIAARQEKVLVFTQYRQITEPLARHLASVFKHPGLVLHGATAVKERKQLVDAFQGDSGPSFFVLSLKAGGTGLNLTGASHVIHFDRWWNPAVENQATDRAFRIGQKRNVMVHKFTCRGTVEERIHELMANKAALAEDVLGQGAERLMTEMNNSELLRFVALDINAASAD
ncbi:MAG: ATP-dependent helicase [Verrucomicrobia bacterium]|nr:MAG: ATP-dependent helicase [Verrucomicrobiota bacterium]